MRDYQERILEYIISFSIAYFDIFIKFWLLYGYSGTKFGSPSSCYSEASELYARTEDSHRECLSTALL